MRRFALVLGLVLVSVVVAASPAGAHGVGGEDPTNDETVVDRVHPALDGVDVRVAGPGGLLVLTNSGSEPVTVMGYSGEPYLRVGPDGAFENVRSPAVFLNRTRIPNEQPPARYDAEAPPEWRRLSTAPRVEWHDHRAHWMGGVRDPAADGVLIRFEIPVTSGRTAADILGEVRYVPGPSPWPWVALAVGVGAVVLLGARTRWWPAVLAVAMVLLLASEVVHVVGVWQGSTASVPERILASVYSLAGIGVGVLALVWTARRGAWAAAPAYLVAGLFLFIAGGLADVVSLSRSQLPTSLDPDVARLTVALALGLGGGIAAGAATRLRPPTVAATPNAPSPARDPAPARS